MKPGRKYPEGKLREKDLLTPQEEKLINGKPTNKLVEGGRWYIPNVLTRNRYYSLQRVIEERAKMRYVKMQPWLVASLGFNERLFIVLPEIDLETQRTLFDPQIFAIEESEKEMREGKAKDVTNQVYERFGGEGIVLHLRPHLSKRSKEGEISSGSEHLG